MTLNFRRVSAVANGQLGSFSRTQAHAAGLTDRQLRGRVQSGLLEQVGAHAFRLPGAPPGLLAELQALLLDIGEPCWASGPTAAALHGFDGFALRRPLHVTVPRERNVRRIGVVVHSSGFMPPLDREELAGMRVTSPTRTLIDLARNEPPERLTAAVDAAFRDGRSCEDALHRRIAALRSRGRYGIPALLGVLDGREVTRGAHSWLEREFLRLIAAAELPRPDTQAVLTKAGDHLVRVDCRFPGTPIVVELLGYRYHRTKAQLTRDAERLNVLVLAGFDPFQFTYDQVVNDSEHVIATVRLALLRLSAAACKLPPAGPTSGG
jgi:hypothetical protein